MRFVCNLGLVLCCLPLLTGAAVYRWVDEDGVVNYTQLKPEGVPSEMVSADTGQRLSEPSPPQPAPARSPANPNDQELDEDQQRMLEDLRAAQAEHERQFAKVREANCQKARDVLERLTTYSRLRVTGEDGEQRVMPEEERQERIDEAQRSVALNCSKTASR